MDHQQQIHRSESYTLTIHECDRDCCPHGSVVDIEGETTQSPDEFVSELNPEDTDPVLVNNTEIELHRLADGVRFCSDCLVSLSSEYAADDYDSINTDPYSFGARPTLESNTADLVAGNGATLFAAVFLPVALLFSLVMLLPQDSEETVQGQIFYSGVLSVLLGVFFWAGGLFILGTYF